MTPAALRELTDEALMVRLGQGEKVVFSELYRRYSGRLTYYFYRMLGRDADLARDKVHDLFMKLLESPSRFDPERKFSVWLFSVASNMCKNEYRSWEVQKRALESGESGPAWTPAAQMEENQPGQKAGLDRAIGELPPAQKEAVVLYYREGLRVNEIAGIMGCSEGTVKSRLFYALKKLGDKLQSTTS